MEVVEVMLPDQTATGYLYECRAYSIVEGSNVLHAFSTTHPMDSKMYRLGVPAIIIGLSACATTGATFRSGVGDSFLEHPPYYAGKRVAEVQPAPRIVHFPVEFQRGASQAPMFDPASGQGSSVAALLTDINTFLDSLSGAALPAIGGKGHVAPNVYFGCDSDPSGDCMERGDSTLGRRGTTMKLAVARPSPEWIARLKTSLDSAGATHALVLTLEVGQYWTRQSGLRGSKSVELGTDYSVPLPWLTSLEAPVSVLQLTGALIDREGRAVRIGAEGILAQRSPLAASAVGAQRVIVEADVENARTLRHTSLPGQPLAWRVAVCHLLTELASKSCG